MSKDLESVRGENGPVGANIYRLRRKLNITQKELAAPKFSVSYISAIERGRIRPSLKALETLALRLGVSTAELLTESQDTPQPASKAAPEGKVGSASWFSSLVNQRHHSYRVSLPLIWASIGIEQHRLEFAEELLNQLTPGSLSAEHRLIYFFLLSRVLLETGRPAEAQALIEPIFQQAEFSGHPELLESCRFRLGCAYAQQGMFLAASDTFTHCAQAISNGLINDPLFVIEVHSTIAEYYGRLNRRDTAIAYYRKALEQLRLVSNPAALAEQSAQMSLHHLESIHSGLAYWYATRSRSFLELAEGRRRITQAALNLGNIFLEVGDSSDAEQQLRQAIGLSTQLETRNQAVLSRLALADLLLKRQELQEAEKLASEARALCHPGGQGTIEDAALYGRTLVVLGTISKALKRQEEAEQFFREAITIFEGQNGSKPLADAYFRYSELLIQKGQTTEGYEMIRQAYLLEQKADEQASP